MKKTKQNAALRRIPPILLCMAGAGLLVAGLCSAGACYAITLVSAAFFAVGMAAAFLALEAVRLEHQAKTDSATELLNKAATERIIEASVKKKKKGSLLLVDIDDLKKTNDTFGHFAGDKAIMVVAQALKQHLQSVETIGRTGGDEFVAYAPVSAEQMAEDVARMLAEISAQRMEWLDGASVCVSVGITEIREDNAAFSTLYQEADRAMYRIKRTCCHGYAIFDLRTDGVVDRCLESEEIR